MRESHDKWLDFLNPSVIRTHFSKMGLYLIAHEMLLDVLKKHIFEFFACEWSDEKGWIISEDYRREILALDPKGKNDALRGSVAWFRRMEAISDDDVKLIRSLTNARNVIAHEMLDVLGGSKELNVHEHYLKVVYLIDKIERWWVVNIDFAVDENFSDFDGNNQIHTGRMLLINALGQIALGDEESAWCLYKEFERTYQNKTK